MIVMNGQAVDINQVQLAGVDNQQLNILERLGASSSVYRYDSYDQLAFELHMRVATVQAALLLQESNASFATFETARCNEQYWQLTRQGGFRLKPNVLPQIGIDDIFLQGHQYAFECAVAIVIIFYKATLGSIDKSLFNLLFANLYLFSWQYDEDLDLRTHEGDDFIPGDCVYFRNPDYDPASPEWQGENAIVIDRNLFFGHGIGLKTQQGMIDILNTKRRRLSQQSAYLDRHITRPNYNYLSQFRSLADRPPVRLSFSSSTSPLAELIFAQVGSRLFLA
ncbi:protein-glutamine gamma-glutamyltransferase [Halalkalibacter oceani]